MKSASAEELRQWADRCEIQAATAGEEEARQVLMRKCAALRLLADSEDWLAEASVLVTAVADTLPRPLLTE